MDRLHRLLDLDDTVANAAALGTGGGSSGSTALGSVSSVLDTEQGRSFERACLRAEREGPAGWVKLLPQLNAHIEKNPQDAQAWAYLGRARLAQGRDSEAMRAAAEATRLDPAAILGHSLSLLVARNSADAGRWEAAGRAAEAALASKAGDAEAMELLVRALAAQGLYDKADGILNVLSQSHGGSRGAAVAKRLADERSREPSERYRWLTKAANIGRGSERPLRELGEVCLMLQRDGEALQWFQRAFQQPGGSSDVDVAQTLARMHVRAGRAEEALDVYRSALGAVPESLALQRSYGQLLLKQGRTAEAVQVIQKTARLSPSGEASALHVTLAELQQGMGQTREALTSWENAASLDSGNVSAWKGLMAVASTTGELSGQARALNKLMVLEPSCADWPARYALLILRRDGTAGRREAMVHLERAVEMKPGHAEALLGLAKLKQDGPEALELFERAARADPSSAEALEQAAALRWAKGHRQEAGDWYKALLDLRVGGGGGSGGTDDALARTRLARALLEERRTSEARSWLLPLTQRERPSEEASALLAYTQLLLADREGLRESLQVAMRCASEEPGEPEHALQRSLCLLEIDSSTGASTERARAEFRRAAERLGALKRLVDDPTAREALRRAGSMPQDSPLAPVLPGADARACRLLESLAALGLGGGGASAAAASAAAAAAAASSPARGGGAAAAVAAAPSPARDIYAAAASPMRPVTSLGGGIGSGVVPASAGASTPASSAAEGTPSREGAWREGMYEGQAIEVYSKSASAWLPGTIAQLNQDMVKVKYLIDGQWCEKKLLRSSDSLRVASASAAAAAAAAGAPSGVAPPAQGGGKPSYAAFSPPLRGTPGSDAAASPPSGVPASASSAAAWSPPASAPALAAESPAPSGARPTSSAAALSSSPAAGRSPAPASSPAASSPGSAAGQRAAVGSPSRSEYGAGSAAASPARAGSAAASSPSAASPQLPPPATSSSTSASPAAPQQRPASGAAPATSSASAAASAAPAAAAGAGGAGKAKTTAAAEEARLREQLLDASLLKFGQALGSGGFGAVYRGDYKGEEVAIKKLHITDGQVTAAQIAEFRKEVENLMALRHPRLVSFIGATLIEDDGGARGGSRNPPSLCIVTEFMPNGSLHALLHTRKEPLTFAQRLAMAVQVTEGVVFLHGRSPPFVHRDLKSLNAVIDFQLNVKLCDFGLTQSMEKTHISRRDNEGGSPRYMAPELFDARMKITEKVDVWALGCLAVEILTSRLPHEECNSIQQVMNKTLVLKQMPFVDWTGVSEDLRILAELTFEFFPTKRVDAARFLEGLQGLSS